ncbi:hypothetical protein Lal_00039749 [Lupinus albus]|nr:hypothetical protein Lal_00039749 [Lupinus albus]
MDSVVIRSGTHHLATSGVTAHGHYGEILYEGDILVTFIYEKSRYGDITQGLPTVEQVVEVCSIDSISMNLENKLTRVQSSISLVNKIQKVYRSQGVHIHNRYLEIIVCQIASKFLVSEDGMSNVFIHVNLLACRELNERGIPWKKRFVT